MAMRKLGTIDSHVQDMEKNAIKRAPCLFLFCSSVILENHKKNLSFNKNYMNTTETSILFAPRGLLLLILLCLWNTCKLAGVLSQTPTSVPSVKARHYCS